MCESSSANLRRPERSVAAASASTSTHSRSTSLRAAEASRVLTIRTTSRRCFTRISTAALRTMPGYLYSSQPVAAADKLGLVVFDKDGTILDFLKTWLPAFSAGASAVAAECGEPDLAPALLKAGGWVDGAEGPYISHDGILLHGTLAQLASAWIETQPIVANHYGRDPAKIEALLDRLLLDSTVRDATPLGAVDATLRRLRRAGVKLAVVTNDQEATAKAQLHRLGWLEHFAIVIGADSGHGAKPGPGGVRAAIEAAGVSPQRAIMVGDAEADQLAGKAAGCAFTVAIWPDGEPLPPALASAACRMETIEALPAALAAAGHIVLPDEADAEEDGCSTRQHALGGVSEAEERAAAAAVAAVDRDVIAMVESAGGG